MLILIHTEYQLQRQKKPVIIAQNFVIAKLIQLSAQ